jgi:hypothetical protein
VARCGKACTQVLGHRCYSQQLDYRPPLGVAESGHGGTAYGGSDLRQPVPPGAPSRPLPASPFTIEG